MKPGERWPFKTAYGGLGLAAKERMAHKGSCSDGIVAVLYAISCGETPVPPDLKDGERIAQNGP